MCRTVVLVAGLFTLVLLAEAHTESQLYLETYNEPGIARQEQTTDTYWSTETEGGHQSQKRFGQLSLNQDLKTLARLLENQQVRRTSGARQKLRVIGKRDRLLPGFFPMFLHRYYQTTQVDPADDSDSSKRGGPRLSVSGALSAIADMVQAQSRRRMFRQMAANRASLTGIGKRSSSETSTYFLPLSENADLTLGGE